MLGLGETHLDLLAVLAALAAGDASDEAQWAQSCGGCCTALREREEAPRFVPCLVGMQLLRPGAGPWPVSARPKVHSRQTPNHTRRRWTRLCHKRGAPRVLLHLVQLLWCVSCVVCSKRLCVVCGLLWRACGVWRIAYGVPTLTLTHLVHCYVVTVSVSVVLDTVCYIPVYIYVIR